jgi:hypothetical protein
MNLLGTQQIPMMQVEIERILRRMRGHSQAFLVEAADGHCYVAKFQGNPQGNRTLINEWIMWRMLQRVGATAPEMRLLRLTESTRDASAELYFSFGPNQVTVAPGLHLGSRCPVDPRTTAIFDFLPSKLLAQVFNLSDFTKVFVLDHVLGQAEARQALFVRDPGQDPGQAGIRAYLIDHGMIFGGSEWVIRDLPRAAIYLDRTVYSLVDMPEVCTEAIILLKNIGEEHLLSATEELPSEWFTAEDYRMLDSLFQQVRHRQQSLEEILSRHLKELGATPSKMPL